MDIQEKDRPSRFGRILGLDLARGAAILGMIVVNFKTTMALGKEGPPWLVATTGLVDGRAAATFVVLAGVGMSLMSRRARESDDSQAMRRIRRTLWRRSAVLFVGGLAFATIWPPDILHYYGVYIALGTLLLTAQDRILPAISSALVFAFPILLLIFDYERGWDWSTLTYTELWTPAGFLRHLFFNGFHPVIPWAAFLVFGLWLGRQDLRNASQRRALATRAAMLAVLVEGLSYALVRAASEELGAEDASLLLGSGMIPPLPFYLLAGAGTAVVVICLSIELQERRPDLWICRGLIATGRLALSHYVIHVVLGMGMLQAMGLLEGQSFVFAVQSALIWCGVTVGLSLLWCANFHRGPFERLLRSVDPRPSPRRGDVG